jgi:hypothetical protein
MIADVRSVHLLCICTNNCSTARDAYGLISADLFAVGLQNRTPIERPAQGLPFDAGGGTRGEQILHTGPLARRAEAPGAAASSTSGRFMRCRALHSGHGVTRCFR